MPVAEVSVQLLRLGQVRRSGPVVASQSLDRTEVGQADSLPVLVTSSPSGDHPCPVERERRFDPDVVVIATPTPTHAAVCQEVGEYFPRAEILLEKPAADNLPAAQSLLKGKPDVYVALHMAFSPEVVWGMGLAKEMADSFGPPRAIQSFHTDAYRADLDSATLRLSNSWVDSGINALSVIDRFAAVIDRQSLRRLGESSWSMFEGNFTCGVDGGQAEAIVVTSWNGADAGRSTRVAYASGAELIMDHNAVEAYALDNGRLIGFFSDNSDVSRLRKALPGPLSVVACRFAAAVYRR